MNSWKKYKSDRAEYNCSGLKTFILFLITYILFLTPASAQQATATINKENKEFVIGDWVPVDLRVNVPFGSVVYFPTLEDSITPSLELANISKLDTVKKAGQYEYHQLANLAVFDTGNVIIPQFQFIVQTGNQLDTIYAESQLIHVSGVKIDTTKDIKPIKEPLKVPITFSEVLPYIIAALIGGILVALILWWRKRRQNKNKPIDLKYLLPPHVWATKEIDKLEKEKLWQQGFVKEFYVRLTDIARTYIELRYKVPAMESTTEELMQSLHKGIIKQQYKQPLNELLMLSDFVKFAKAQPDLRDNEHAVLTVKEFIEQTKPKEEVENKSNIKTNKP